MDAGYAIDSGWRPIHLVDGLCAATILRAGSSAAGLKWWQIGAGQEARSVWGTTFAAALSPDGKLLATAALRQPSASVYDRPNVASGRPPQRRATTAQMFAAHEVGVSGLVFSPHGKWLATAGQESRLDPRNLGASLASMRHSIKFWDTATWQMCPALQFVGMAGGLGNFSPDGRLLAVTSQNSVTFVSVPEQCPAPSKRFPAREGSCASVRTASGSRAPAPAVSRSGISPPWASDEATGIAPSEPRERSCSSGCPRFVRETRGCFHHVCGGSRAVNPLPG